jgi:tetratricopeptide (TPR) repeat protein
VARRIDDQCGQAHALRLMGQADLLQGRYEQAISHLESSLDIFRRTGEQTGEAAPCNGLGDVLQAAGHLRQARDHWQQALTLYTSMHSPAADQVRALLSAAEPSGVISE